MSTSKAKTSLLDVVPCHGVAITTVKEGDEIIIAFPRFKRAWIQRLLLPKGMSPDIHIRLEGHGTAVWELIDGKRTVGEIIEKLAAHFQGEANYEFRVTTYICRLQKDGFIRFLLPGQP